MITDPSEDWVRLQETSRGRPVVEVEQRYRDLIRVYGIRGISDVDVELTARVMSDPAWVRHHPVDAVRFCWRHRRRSGVAGAVRGLGRPRFAG